MNGYGLHDDLRPLCVVDRLRVSRVGPSGAIEDGRWKLVHVPSEQYQRQMQKMPYELNEVRADPMETNNVAAKHPGLVRVLVEILEQRLREAGPVNEAPKQLSHYSQEELDNLRSLGYIR